MGENERLRPDSEDVVAACAFLRAMQDAGLPHGRLTELAGTVADIFRAWVATLDLGGG